MRRMRAYHLVHTHLVWESVQCSKFEGMCQVNNKTARTQLQLLLLFLVLSLLPILPSQSVEDVKESAYTTQCTAIVIYPLLNLRTHQIEWGGRQKSRIQIHIMSLVFTFCCIGAMCNSPWKRQQQHIVFVKNHHCYPRGVDAVPTLKAFLQWFIGVSWLNPTANIIFQGRLATTWEHFDHTLPSAIEIISSFQQKLSSDFEISFTKWCWEVIPQVFQVWSFGEMIKSVQIIWEMIRSVWWSRSGGTVTPQIQSKNDENDLCGGKG